MTEVASPEPTATRASLRSCPWLRPGAIVSFLLVLLFSATLNEVIWRKTMAEWAPQMGGDSPSYTFYAGHVFGGYPYSEDISDIYFFRTWGYPWLVSLWQRGKDPHVPQEKGALTHLEWTRDGNLYRGLSSVQVHSVLLLVVAAWVLAFYLSRSPVQAAVAGLFIETMGDLLFWARWVLPESPAAVLNILVAVALVGLLHVRKRLPAAMGGLLLGLLAGFLLMLRPNYQVVPMVAWIAAGMVLAVAGWQTTGAADMRKTLATVLLPLTFGVVIVVQLTLHARWEYGKAGMLSDGLASRGCNVAARFYKDLDPARLAPDVRRVREYMLTQPPPPEDPRYAYPAVMYYLNHNAFAVDMTPTQFRKALASLNLAVMKDRPWYWFRHVFLPAWRDETKIWSTHDIAMKDPGFRASPAGIPLVANRRIREIANRIIDPTALLVLCTVFLLLRARDWRVAFTILLLTGTHLASLSVSSLLGFPAEGRYRMGTEAGAMVLVVLAVLELARVTLCATRDHWRRLRSASPT